MKLSSAVVMMKLFFLFLYIASAFPQQSEISLGTLKRIYPSAVTQTEVLITRSPIETGTLFASANAIKFTPFFVSEGIYVTTNSGADWYGSDTCKGGPFLTFHGGDPGIAIDKDGTFILIRRGNTPLTGLYAHYSTNKGLTWSNQIAITTEDLERGVLASDGNPASPYYGRTYAAWVKYAPPFPISFCYSTNGGANWSATRVVNNPVNRNSGGDIVIGVNGEVFLTWAAVTGTSPFTEIAAGFASSTDGGANWSVNESAITLNGISGVLSAKQNIRVNSIPRIDVDKTNGPHRGHIYLVTTQKNLPPAGSDPDIVLYKSTDNGATWSGGIRVNGDAINNGKTQYFPAVSVDDYGGVNVIYYDDRNTTNDSASVFLSRSTDGGTSWTDYQLTLSNFKPAPIGGLGQGYQGDNIGITSSGGKIFPVWMDNSSGIYQIWTREVNVSLVGVDEQYSEKEFRFFNYPNPFRDYTNIEVEGGVVSGEWLVASGELGGKRSGVTVYNVMGEVVAELELKPVGAGKAGVVFNAGSLPSGIYFAILTNGSVRKFLRMALVK